MRLNESAALADATKPTLATATIATSNTRFRTPNDDEPLTRPRSR